MRSRYGTSDIRLLRSSLSIYYYIGERIKLEGNTDSPSDAERHFTRKSKPVSGPRVAQNTQCKKTPDVSAAVHVTSIGDASLPNPVEQRKDDSSSTRVIEDGRLSMLASLNSAFRHTGSGLRLIRPRSDLTTGLMLNQLLG